MKAWLHVLWTFCVQNVSFRQRSVSDSRIVWIYLCSNYSEEWKFFHIYSRFCFLSFFPFFFIKQKFRAKVGLQRLYVASHVVKIFLYGFIIWESWFVKLCRKKFFSGKYIFEYLLDWGEKLNNLLDCKIILLFFFWGCRQGKKFTWVQHFAIHFFC